MSKLEIKPSKKVVVLRKVDLPNTTHLIAVQKDAPEIGEIIAIGEGKKPIEFNRGDKVAYRQFGEFEFLINGENLYFVKFADILGIIKEVKNCCKE